jgi:hypothetical protein
MIEMLVKAIVADVAEACAMELIAKPTIFLMQLLYFSTTYTFPAESTATPIGVRNEAATPVPLANPIVTLPARVDTTPVDAMILRMQW